MSESLHILQPIISGTTKSISPKSTLTIWVPIKISYMRDEYAYDYRENYNVPLSQSINIQRTIQIVQNKLDKEVPNE